MGIKEKKEIVKEIKDKIDRANSICFTNFLELGASQMNELRRNLEKEDAEMKVFKNRLIRKALKEHSLDNLTKFVEGPVAIIFGYDDPILPLKIVSDFKEEEDKPGVNGGYLEGEIFDKKAFSKLASIPSKEELHRMFLNTLYSPLNKMIFILSNLPRKLISVLKEIAKRKEE
ncbi:MAG: 50S ribosomal protein L10 [candidate division WOR-3 bacterium]|nr:50S ribosomal protein L10 [candidate division WOR-3 bacterium]